MIGRAECKDTNTHVLKFAPKKSNINYSMNRCLCMNAAGHYHDPHREHSYTLEMKRHTERTSTPIDKLLIYCMSTVRENDIGDDAVMIPRLMLNEFKFGTGFISAAKYN